MSRKRRSHRPPFLQMPLDGGVKRGGFIDLLTGDELRLFLLVLAAQDWKEGGDGGVRGPRSLPYSVVVERCHWSRGKVVRVFASLEGKGAIVRLPAVNPLGTIRPMNVYGIGPLHPWIKRVPSTHASTGPGTHASTDEAPIDASLVRTPVPRRNEDFIKAESGPRVNRASRRVSPLPGTHASTILRSTMRLSPAEATTGSDPGPAGSPAGCSEDPKSGARGSAQHTNSGGSQKRAVARAVENEEATDGQVQ